MLRADNVIQHVSLVMYKNPKHPVKAAAGDAPSANPALTPLLAALTGWRAGNVTGELPEPAKHCHRIGRHCSGW